MHTPPEELRAVQGAALLEPLLAEVESRLAALGAALRQADPRQIDVEASALHRALADAVHHFGRAARLGGVPAPLRQRLAVAGGQVAAQREALARATASLDRAIDALLPDHAAAVYADPGANPDRGASGGSLCA